MIEALQDKAMAVMTCYDNYTNCERVSELADEINELFTDNRAGVMLATGHRAKGLEAGRVFVLEPENLPMAWKGTLPILTGRPRSWACCSVRPIEAISGRPYVARGCWT